MYFSPPLQPAILLSRYKRFLADIQLPNGKTITVHCPNTGAMTRCIVEGSPCWYSVSDNPKRKYPFTLEIVTTPDSNLACIHSRRANMLVEEALEADMITALSGYGGITREVKYGDENSRIDFLLSGSTRNMSDCYVEVKSVTLGLSDGRGLFPDAVSQRGAKHLRELMAVKHQGYRAVLLFCVQHNGIERVSPADEIDPIYGVLLREAVAAGVEVLAYRADISPRSLQLVKPLPVAL